MTRIKHYKVSFVVEGKTLCCYIAAETASEAERMFKKQYMVDDKFWPYEKTISKLEVKFEGK